MTMDQLPLIIFAPKYFGHAQIHRNGILISTHLYRLFIICLYMYGLLDQRFKMELRAKVVANCDHP